MADMTIEQVIDWSESMTPEEALEKQKPKKPIIVRFLNVNYPQCPICKRTLWKASEKYCATCGQKIDWSE